MNRSWNKVIWYLEDVLAKTGVADSEKELMTRTRNIISKTIFTLVRWYFNDWTEPSSLPLVGHEFVMTTIAHTGVFLTSLEIWDFSDKGMSKANGT